LLFTHTGLPLNRDQVWEIWERTKSLQPSEELIRDLECMLVHPYQLYRIEAAERLGRLSASQSIPMLAAGLNDRCEYVAAASAEALALIGNSEALEVLSCSFEDDQIEKPHYLANAISKFGLNGFEVLKRCASSNSATLRYFSARGLGSTGIADALPILEKLAESDFEKTLFGGAVSTAAKDAITTLKRLTKPDDK